MADSTPPLGRTGRSKGCLSRLLALFALLVLTVPAARSEAPLVLHRQSVSRPVGPGVELTQIRQFDSDGWLNLTVLEIDLTEPTVEIDAILGNNRLTGSQGFSVTAAESGAIAGINGDFFHIQTTRAPIGIHVQSGELFKSPPQGTLAVGFFNDRGRAPLIGEIGFRGQVTAPNGARRRLDAWNPAGLPPHGLAFYNHRWDSAAPGAGSPDMPADGLVHVVLNASQRVEAVLQDSPGPRVPDGGGVLAGRGDGASWLLEHARKGKMLTVDVRLDPPSLRAAIGGRPVLLQNGEIPPDFDDAIHPRSAIGFNRDGTRAWWVVVDGRSTLSRGVTLHQMARLLKDFGATEALNLDGGGSATLLARTPGEWQPIVWNLPSDGRERPLPNGLGIFNHTPAGAMNQLLIPLPPPNDPHLIESIEFRVAPGATVLPSAVAVDAQNNRVELPGEIVWSVSPKHLGTFAPDGTFTASQPGRGTITASVTVGDQTFSASQPLRVIGEPVALRIEPGDLAVGPRETVELQINAVDIHGFSAPVPPEDVRWSVHGSIGTVTPGGHFTAADATASGSVDATFREARGVVTVGIGASPEPIADFGSEDGWTALAAPEETASAVSVVDHPPYLRDGRATAKLAYDFSHTGRTRAAYLRPPEGDIRLPGRPLKLGLWVFGDGHQAWLRARIADSSGTARAIDFARHVDWTGWRYVEAEIPPGTAYPIAVQRIYVAETRPDARYTGAVFFDQLLVVNAPELDPASVITPPEVRDPANRPVDFAGPAPENGRFRFVVFGDSKVQADRPEAAETEVLAALIERINEHDDIEFVLFTGDLIENDTEANYTFGRDFLNRLKKPCHMAIANHEIAGSDTCDRYRKFFGDTYYGFSHGNSEFLILNTARPGLRESEEQQWPWLRDRVEESNAKNLFLMTHTPVVDPMPGGKTGWTDAGEIAIFQRLLADHAEEGRNVYVFHGHVHGFDRRAHDGVQYLTSAGAGSPLYLPPDRGGFFHYVVVTVDGSEVTYQVIPLLEAIRLPERVRLQAGQTVRLDALGIAPGNLVAFPLRYPAAVEWEFSNPGIVRGNPADGTLLGVAAGETNLTVGSGGITATTTIVVTP